MLKILAIALLTLTVGGCVADQPRLHNDLAGFAPQQIALATHRAETPARISTVGFKELGDSKRYALVSRLIGATWHDACDPVSLQPHGYSQNGASEWVVHCKDTFIPQDYIVAIPEQAKDDARVLKCHQVGPRNSTCSIVGPSETALARTSASQ